MSDHTLPLFSLQEETEHWRDVPGYEGLYQASDHGRVRGLDRVISRRMNGKDFVRNVKGKIISPPRRPDGYFHLCLKKTDGSGWMVTLHRLIAYVFLGPRPEGCTIHHKDGDKHNNRVSNLEYMDGRHHTRIHHEGEKAGMAKLTREQVTEIRRKIAVDGATVSMLMKQYDVTDSTIRHIRDRRTWRHI